MTEAIFALIGVAVGALASGVVNLKLQNRQFAHEKEMHSLKNQAREHVKALLVEMLSHDKWVDRSFDAIRKKLEASAMMI
ncbi:hypothetical protein [Pseudohalioglobus lutimaris]|uniref:Uncharacterized protein n=1 Tax=Pseudohalioglobus lutimaris TaxID=1737061 RepID=A0A2N5X1B0_9GAMM|nr:hypothetical protein [Pseudohalioglobus lutimaris]PLW68273.1 hypothetical protein C0039_13170 [Pseudohalioglobus lutimaris]